MPRKKLTSGNSQLVVEPDSGQIISWSVNNKDILYVGSSDKRSGIPVLFPFADPLENDTLTITGTKIPQHGFGRYSKWKVTSQSGYMIQLELRYEDLDEQWREAYPFEFVCQLQFSIDKDSLIYSIQVLNIGQVNIPIAPGIHPYFPLLHKNKSKIRLSNGFDGSMFDWDGASNGHYTQFLESNIIDLVEYKIQISEISANKSFQHLVIWSQPKSMKDYDFVCIEPFTRKSNGINTDPIIIKPNQTWSSKIQFKLI